MKTGFLVAAVICAMCGSALGGPRSSASYSVTGESTNASGAASRSQDYTFETAAVGEFGTATAAVSDSSAYINKPGFVGQFYNLIALNLGATSGSVDERDGVQLTAIPLADDNTTLAALDPSSVNWTIISGPLTSISPSGFATAATVYQESLARAGATALGVPGDITLRVGNSNVDDFGSYADDAIDDAWQVAYFGEENLAAAPATDADGDGEDNLSEFRSATLPTDGNSVIRSARAVNIATRLRVLTGTNVLIGGFIISGAEPKKVIIRGIGASLAAAGVADALRDPVLELFDVEGNSIGFNNDWKEAQQGEIEATTIPPSNDLESAIVQTLEPGNYTAVVSGFGGGIGIGLVEVYDLQSGQPAKLANIATRGFVDNGDNVMIGGFIIGGGLGTNGSGTARLLLRAIGPSLGAAGVENALQDPTLELVNSNGDTVAANNNWRDAQEAEIEATTIPPSNDLEAAIVQVVPAGAYTAVVRGFSNGTGVGLVEVYNLP